MPRIAIQSLCAPWPPGAGHSGDRNWGRGPSLSLRREGVPGSPLLYNRLLNAARSSGDQVRLHPSLHDAHRLVGEHIH